MQRDKRLVHLELLAVRARDGDQAALEELIRLCQPRLLYFIRRLVPREQDAADVLQQTWIKVLRHIGSLREPRSTLPWLYRIARNTAFNHGRLEGVYRAGLQRESENHVPEEQDLAGRFEDAEEVHRGLLLLSLPHREVLTLFFLEDMGIEEIAAVLLVPAGTVKSRLFHARRALREILEKRRSE